MCNESIKKVEFSYSLLIIPGRMSRILTSLAGEFPFTIKGRSEWVVVFLVAEGPGKALPARDLCQQIGKYQIPDHVG